MSTKESIFVIMSLICCARSTIDAKLNDALNDQIIVNAFTGSSFTTNNYSERLAGDSIGASIAIRKNYFGMLFFELLIKNIQSARKKILQSRTGAVRDIGDSEEIIVTGIKEKCTSIQAWIIPYINRSVYNTYLLYGVSVYQLNFTPMHHSQYLYIDKMSSSRSDPFSYVNARINLIFINIGCCSEKIFKDFYFSALGIFGVGSNKKGDLYLERVTILEYGIGETDREREVKMPFLSIMRCILKYMANDYFGIGVYASLEKVRYSVLDGTSSSVGDNYNKSYLYRSGLMDEGRYFNVVTFGIMSSLEF